MKFERYLIEDELIDAYSGDVAIKAKNYVKRIKNSKKKEYAKAYYKWMIADKKTKEPDHGELSLMGAQAVRMNLDDLFKGLSEAPIGAKGWTQKSITKFGKTVGVSPKEKGFFSACVARMEGKEGFDKERAEGFCASLKDAAHGSPMWRGKGKTEKEVKTDVKKKKFKKQLPK